MSYNQDGGEGGYKKPWEGNKKPWEGNKKQWNANKPNVDNVKVDLLGKQLTKFFDIFIRTLKNNNMVLDEKIIAEFNETASGKVKGFCVAVPNINDDYLFDKINRYAEESLQKGYTFRHINVTYVEKKLDSRLDKKKAYIPWAGYNDSKADPITDKKSGEEYFAENQKGWEEWKPFLKAIFLATYAMLMGENGEGKVAFVLAYKLDKMDNSPEYRDMSRVIKVARALDIPIYDIDSYFEIPS